MSETTCPVCHMTVDADHLAREYLGMRFAFCSQQCRERFDANPHLYVGHPGHPAPAQSGETVIKERTLRLAAPLTAVQAARVVEELQSMMGVFEVAVAGDRLRIRYDLLQATAEHIARRLTAIGNALEDGLGEKLRRAFVHYLEETELANLEQQGGSHGHHH